MNLVRFIKNALVHYTWALAYFDYDSDILKNGLNFHKIHIIKNPYKGKWFADPFILHDSEEELTLLVEEFDKHIKRGRIAQVVIDKKKDIISSCDIILEQPTHLSFPAIYRIEGKVFVHPENSASGASYMYEYNEYLKKLVNPVKVLDEPVTDAIIKEENGEYNMYTTISPDSNGSCLKLYTSNNFWGPYTASGEEEFPHSRARMAGHFFNDNGKSIRPAQDCEGSYGKAIIFYDEHCALGEIRPSNYAGAHTFNIMGKTAVIDIKLWDYPLFVSLKDKIKKKVWAD